MCKLMRFAVSQVIDPQIAGSGRSCMVVKETRSVASKGRNPLRRIIQPFGKRQGARLSGCDFIQVEIGAALDVRAVSQKFAIGSKFLPINLPLVLREPVDFLRRGVKQAGVVIAIAGIGGDENVPAVRRNVSG